MQKNDPPLKSRHEQPHPVGKRAQAYNPYRGGKKTRAGPDIVHPARPLPPCYYDKSKSYESAYQKNSRLLRIAVLLVNCA